MFSLPAQKGWDFSLRKSQIVTCSGCQLCINLNFIESNTPEKNFIAYLTWNQVVQMLTPKGWSFTLKHSHWTKHTIHETSGFWAIYSIALMLICACSLHEIHISMRTLTILQTLKVHIILRMMMMNVIHCKPRFWFNSKRLSTYYLNVSN